MPATTQIDYGPLTGLIGTWEGDKGMDVSPEPEGKEENPFFETILFEAIGDVKNAGTQVLAAIRYHQVVSRKSDKKVFHNETGYWMWDAANKTVMHSLTIPRAVCVLAGGDYGATDKTGGPVKIQTAAKMGDAKWGILQSPFMQEKARTVEFRHSITIDGDKLAYSQTTFLEIYGKSFEHTDKNELVRTS